jgi:uncharacterized membrane protein
VDVEHRAEGAAPDRREYRVSTDAIWRAAGVFLVLGGLLVFGTFPFIYGDPDETGVKSVPPAATALSAVGLGLMLLAWLCAIVRWLRRPRPAAE